MKLTQRLLVLLITVTMLMSGSFVQVFATEEAAGDSSVVMSETAGSDDTVGSEGEDNKADNADEDKKDAVKEETSSTATDETTTEKTEKEEAKAEAGADADVNADTDVAEDKAKEAKAEDTADKETKEPAAGKLTYDCDDYTVTLEYGKKAGIPEGTVLDVREILADSKDKKERKEYKEYYEKSLEQIRDEKNDDSIEKLSFARFYDITLMNDGKEIEPKDDVTVTFAYNKGSRQSVASKNSSETISVVHLSESEKNGKLDAEVIADKDTDLTLEKKELKEVGFTTDSFSVYGIVETTLEKVIKASDGKTYKISVSYDESAGIPADAELNVKEVSEADYKDYLTGAAKALDTDIHSISYGKLFDISIVKDGQEYQPDEKVEVTVELLDTKNVNDVKVVHFENKESAEELSADTSGSTVTFETEGFSVFSFIDFSILDHASDAVLGEKQGKLYENDEIVLSGSMPAQGIVEAKRVEPKIDDTEVLVAYDIKIYANSLMKELGINWQPSAGSIQVKVKSDAIGEKKVDIYHIADGSSEPELVADSAAVKNNSVTFDAESFSVYVLTPETYRRTYRFFTFDENMQYVEYRLYTDSGSTTYTQNIKSGESLVVPQLPSIPGNDTSTFAGWHQGTVAGNVNNQPINPSTVTLDENEFDFDNIPPITQDGEEVYLFARFAGYAYVIFHDQYNGSINDGQGGFPVALTRRGEKEDSTGDAEVQISDFSVAYDDDTTESSAPSMAFYGWSYTPIKEAGSAEDDEGNPVSKILTDSISIRDTVHLYPIFRPIHWLQYYSGPTGSGATYIPSAYYYEGEGPESLTVPVRSGYSFDGWYTGSVDDNDNVTYSVQVANVDGSLVNGATDNANGVSVSDGKLLLSKNATIYAKWREASVNYTIVIWRQKSTDAANLANDAKKYDYAESKVLSATTGSTVSVGNPYKQYAGSGDYVGFTYSRCDDSTTVEANGSTVLNVYYDRNVHTLTFRSSNGNTTIQTITELYGHNISDRFPIVGTDGTTYTAERWKPQTNNVGWTQVMTSIQTMPDGDVKFNRDNPNYSYPTKTMYYYVEALPGEAGTRSFNGKSFVQYGNPVQARYNGVTEEDFVDLTGFEQFGWTDANGNSTPYDSEFYIYSTRWDQSIYFYYTRNSYNISFLDSYTNTHVYVGGSAADNQLSDIEIAYDDNVNSHVPDDPTPVEIAGSVVNPRDGYHFTGWYTDPACSTRIFFEDNDEYRNYTDHKVLWDKMPAYNLRAYAGWDTIWYKIIIDPNYGWLSSPDSGQGSGTGSTWFWEPYNGDPIEEYTWVKRDYVESNDGTYFYHYDKRSDHGWPEEWSAEEDADQNRYAYYTTDQGQATDHTCTFKKAENAYRYAGWYEVDPETGEETLYNFGEPVKHDTYLALHWKKIGTYHVQYNPVVTQDGETIRGTIDNGDSNETLFAELDGDDYADNATVVASRTAHAPDGYNFVGWKIRGDNSGTVYNPGQAFTMLSKYTVTMPEGETIFLDAVYTRVGTAKIVYDANGGTINAAELDYGSPTDTTATPSTSCDADAGTATIEHLINNSEIRLSSGEGFTMENAELVGWNTKPDATGEHFNLDTNYYVDTEEPVTLYAEWKVKVYFHRNKAQSAWGDINKWDGYTQFSEDVFYTTVYVNKPVAAPTDIPVTTADPTDDLFFRYWGTQRYSDVETIDPYDFDTPVTGELHLYAYWAGPIELPIHVLDSTNEEISQVDNWRKVNHINVYPGDSFTFSEGDIAQNYVNVPNGYDYGFTAVHKSTDSIQIISEDNKITDVYYNQIERKLYVKFADQNRDDEPLDDADEVYFVYYKQKSLNIGYDLINTDGSFTGKNPAAQAPTNTGDLGSYSLQDSISKPLQWVNYPSGGSTYFAYALGSSDATNSSGLHIITTTSNRDNSRPAFSIRNTWRGFEYTTDGTNWVKCGYDGIKLYVVYFESQPTIVTLNEKTIGPEADMDEDFTYSIKVVPVTRTRTRTETQTRNNYWNDWGTSSYSDWTDGSSSEGSAVQDYSVSLSNGESESVTLFHTEDAPSMSGWSYNSNYGEYYSTRRTRTITQQVIEQKIVIVQGSAADRGFTTSNESSAGTGTQPYSWTYTTSEADTEAALEPVVTYTNKRTPLTVEAHLAIVDGDSIKQRDNDRKSAASPYTISLDLGDKKVFEEEIASEDLYEAEGYGFAGVYYGTDEGSEGSDVTLTELTENVTYGQMDPPDGNIYELYLDEDSGKLLGDNKIYYLYYPLPHVQYMKEGAGGALTKIVDDGQHPLNSNSTVTLNGATVTQNQMLKVSTDVFTVTQDTVGTATNNYFNMPLILDDTTETPAVPNYLRYTKLGVGVSGVTDTDDLNIMDAKAVQLKLDNGKVKWSQDGTTWNSFEGAPTVYAIYKEIGYELRVTKAVTGEGADPSHEFTLTISSNAITENSYEVTGTGYPTIDATPASGLRPGTITLTIHHGSDITIKGLSRGDYTLKESAGAVMSAKIGDVEQSVSSNKLDINLNANTKVDLFNEMMLPAPTDVALRLMPFILMLLAGEALIILRNRASRRRKTTESAGEEEE